MWPFGSGIFGFWCGFGEGAGLRNPVTEPKRRVRCSLGEGGSQKPKRLLLSRFPSNGCSIFENALCPHALLTRLFHRPPPLFAVEKFCQLREVFRRGNMRAMQPHLAIFHFRPNAPLRLHHAKKAWPAEFFQRRDCFAERLIGIKMQNRFPTRVSVFGNPLFNGEKSVRHTLSGYGGILPVWKRARIIATRLPLVRGHFCSDTNFRNRHESGGPCS